MFLGDFLKSIKSRHWSRFLKYENLLVLYILRQNKSVKSPGTCLGHLFSILYSVLLKLRPEKQTQIFIILNKWIENLVKSETCQLKLTTAHLWLLQMFCFVRHSSQNSRNISFSFKEDKEHGQSCIKKWLFCDWLIKQSIVSDLRENRARQWKSYFFCESSL